MIDDGKINFRILAETISKLRLIVLPAEECRGL